MGELTPLSQIYTPRFFARRFKLNWRAIPFCQSVLDTFALKRGSTIIDVGCATGDFVSEFNKLGMIAFGIEGSESALEYLECSRYHVMVHDLRQPLPDDLSSFDFCQCLEVAEHIEPEYADMFVDNLCHLSGTIMISAAGPGQGGHHHVNCQPKEYWVDKFNTRDYSRRPEIENKMAAKLFPHKNKAGIKAYYYNLIVFTRN